MFDWFEDIYDTILGFFSEMNPYAILIVMVSWIMMLTIVWKSSLWVDMDTKTKVLISVFSGPLAFIITYAMRSK